MFTLPGTEEALSRAIEINNFWRSYDLSWYSTVDYLHSLYCYACNLCVQDIRRFLVGGKSNDGGARAEKNSGKVERKKPSSKRRRIALLVSCNGLRIAQPFDCIETPVVGGMIDFLLHFKFF